MRNVRTSLVRACLRLYPRSWRDRYADEVLVLVEDAGAGIGDLIDLAVGGLGRRADDLQGGASVPSFVRWSLLVAAVVLAMPTAIFIGFQLLNPNVGLVPPTYANWLIPLLPVVALLIALAPVVRVQMRRDEAGVTTVTTRVLPMRRALVAVVIFCGALLAVVVGYGISENLLEALR